MIIYHTMNYFSNAKPEHYGYIRFISGSFIYISGYIIAIFNETRYLDNRSRITKRLFIRGIKLALIFTALNLAISLTGIGSPNKIHFSVAQYVNNIIDIYVKGTPRIAAFQILLPISYLLIISPVCLFFSKYKTALISLVIAIAIQSIFMDIYSAIFELGIVGLIGFCSGIVSNNIKKSMAIKNRFFFTIFFCIIYFCE